MSRSAEVTLVFAGEDVLFKLGIGQLRAVQERCDVGPMELAGRFASGAWRVDDLREVILQGQIGGGATVADATRRMKSFFDDLPLQQFVPLAQAIVLAVLVGTEDEPLGEAEGEGAETPNLSPEESSDSATSTEPGPPSE